MVISLVVAAYFTWVHDALAASPAALVPELLAWQKLVWGTAITTLGWLASAWLLPPEKREVLEAFVKQTGVSGAGWRGYGAATGGASVGRGLAQAFLGCVAVYGALMATGSFLYGHGLGAGMLAALALAAAGGVLLLHRKD